VTADVTSGDPRFRWDELQTTALAKGISAAVVVGDRLSAARYLLDPGTEVPEHSHDNEEFGHVLRGAIELRCNGATATVGEGDAFVVPAGVRHSARALDDGCQLLECYAPPRVPQSPGEQA
jgi:quercetin dioxygenase-like cupin family protein